MMMDGEGEEQKKGGGRKNGDDSEVCSPGAVDSGNE